MVWSSNGQRPKPQPRRHVSGLQREYAAPKAGTSYGKLCREPEHLVTTYRGRWCSVGPCSGTAVTGIDVRAVCDQVPVQQIGPVESEKHILY